MRPEAYSYRRDNSVAKFADDHPVMIYDGYCGLCSSAVQFVLRHDRQLERADSQFRPLQGAPCRRGADQSRA